MDLEKLLRVLALVVDHRFLRLQGNKNSTQGKDNLLGEDKAGWALVTQFEEHEKKEKKRKSTEEKLVHLGATTYIF